MINILRQYACENYKCYQNSSICCNKNGNIRSNLVILN